MNKRFREKLQISSLRRFIGEDLIIPGSRELDELIALAESRRSRLLRPHFEELVSLLDRIFDSVKPGLTRLSGNAEITRAIELLHPWRKGPFEIGDLTIDAEWRSNLKWDRIQPTLEAILLDGKVAADIGCGNGYYMFRLLELSRQRGEQLKGLIGFDPSENFFFQFELLSELFGVQSCVYELLGLEDLTPFAGQFDLLLLMGVIYHQRDPLAALESLRSLLKPGGAAIVESIVIPGEGDDFLNPMEGPSGRYAKMRNVHWLPTVPLLEHTLRDAGFGGVELVSCEVTEVTEQRSTPFMRYESLADFLDPANPKLTVEGYPRPRRAVFLLTI